MSYMGNADSFVGKEISYGCLRSPPYPPLYQTLITLGKVRPTLLGTRRGDEGNGQKDNRSIKTVISRSSQRPRSRSTCVSMQFRATVYPRLPRTSPEPSPCASAALHPRPARPIPGTLPSPPPETATRGSSDPPAAASPPRPPNEEPPVLASHFLWKS